MEQDNEVFRNIADELNCEFQTEKKEEKEIATIKNEIKVIEDKKNELVETSKKKVLSLEDKEYLRTEVKSIVSSGKSVLTKLENEIKIGSSVRVFEVYSYLMNAVISSLKELRELNTKIYDIEHMQEMFNDNPKTTNVNINLDAKELLTLINEAKTKNQLNAIDASFKIEEEKIQSKIKKDD